MKKLLLLALLCAPIPWIGGFGQVNPSPREIAASVREYRKVHEAAIVGELTALLGLPNIAADEPDMRRNAALLKSMLEKRGFAVRFLEVAQRGPVIIGDLPAPSAGRSLVFYAHYDGQPVEAAGPVDSGLG